MAKIITKGLIGLQDLNATTSTFTRATSTGGTQTLQGIPLFIGTGSPNGVVTASPGSLYLNLSGGSATTLYVKESGTATNTGWVGK
jgi:hypothetical protein